jgi:alkylated DNA nucleotide flippase Atl1
MSYESQIWIQNPQETRKALTGKAKLITLLSFYREAMPTKRKSWTEKLADSKCLPQVEKITEKMSKRWGTGTVVIPAPMEVDAMMRKVPEGKLVTINEIRSALAKKHKATIGCPITTGIFASIAAHAAEEQRREGKKDITPYWRILKAGGVVNEKYPGGVEGQKKLLEKEGQNVIQKGKKYVVADYEKSLIKL